MRKLYWYLSSYTRKHGLLVIVSVVIAIIAFSFLIPFIVTRLDQKQRTYVGVVGDYSLYSLPRPVQQLMSSGLTVVAEDGSAVPDLSERWSVESDGTVYRFVLKKGLYWQDGQEILPSDLKYNFSDVEVVYTPNDIVFKLPDAYVPFPVVVSEPVFKTEQRKSMFFMKRTYLIGTGEYQMIDYQEKGPRITELTLDSPQERRIFRFYLTEEEAILGFKRGEVDILQDLSSPQELAEWPTVEVHEDMNNQQYLAVFFNLEDPLFTKNVRQALSYGTRKPTGKARAISPINPDSWAYLSSAKSYDYEVARGVERLLDEIPPQALQFEITTTPVFQKDAELIKQDWEALGQAAQEACQQKKEITDKTECEKLAIEVNVRISSFPDTSNFQALLLGLESPPDPDQYYLWHSEQSTNFSHYKNTRIDSLLEKGRKTADQTERMAIYQEFQQFFSEDAPAIFLQHLTSYDLQRK